MTRSRPRAQSRSRFRADERGVSTALGYVLGLGIASLLITGVLFSAGGYVESEREQVVRAELEVVGESLAADIEGADRLAASTRQSRVEVASPLPERVGESSYLLELTDSGTAGDFEETTLTLVSPAVDVSVTVQVVTRTDLVTPTTVDGGEVVVVYDGTSLEVRSR